jgi:hypothetical protein
LVVLDPDGEELRLGDWLVDAPLLLAPPDALPGDDEVLAAPLVLLPPGELLSSGDMVVAAPVLLPAAPLVPVDGELVLAAPLVPIDGEELVPAAPLVEPDISGELVLAAPLVLLPPETLGLLVLDCACRSAGRPQPRSAAAANVAR